MVKKMQVSQLPDERALLQMELDRLAQENADLRGSARIWIRMYEQLLGFYLTGVAGNSVSNRRSVRLRQLAHPNPSNTSPPVGT